jgi:hypothetical protein
VLGAQLLAAMHYRASKRSRLRCHVEWPYQEGDGCGLPAHDPHRCARPPGHPPPCMCFCGDRPPA